MSVRTWVYAAFLLLLPQSVFACVGFDVAVVEIKACADLIALTASADAKIGGISVASFGFSDSYPAEHGEEFDNMYTIFSVPTGSAFPPAVRVKIRILKRNRGNGEGFFNHKGDVIYETAVWNPGKYIDCPFPNFGDLGHHCWDQASAWQSAGRL